MVAYITRRLLLLIPMAIGMVVVTFGLLLLVPGDPAYADIERRLAALPAINVPSITFDGIDDGVRPPADAAAHAQRFTGPRSHRWVPGVGHNMPQEVPQVFADAVLEMVAPLRRAS